MISWIWQTVSLLDPQVVLNELKFDRGNTYPVLASFFLFSVSLLFSFTLIFIIGLVVLDREGRCSPNRVSYGHPIQVPSTSCSPCRICFCSASRTTEGEPAWSAGGRPQNLSSTEGTHTLCQHLFSFSWLLYPFVLFDIVVSNVYKNYE